MNEFKDKFKKFDNRQLLKIVAEPENYQVAAIEAAKTELKLREVTDDESREVLSELNELRKKKKHTDDQLKNGANSFGDFVRELSEILKPIHASPQSQERKINLMVLVFGSIALYRWYKELPMYFSYIGNWSINDILGATIYHLPVLLLSIGVVLFWLRKRLGWFIMSAFFLFQLCNYFLSLLFTCLYKTNISNIDIEGGEGLQLVDVEFDYFNSPNVIELAVSILAYLICFWAIGKKDIRAVFNISTENVLVIVLGTVLLNVLIFTHLIYE